MKRVNNVEVEKYRVTKGASILIEHDLTSDVYFATVVVPEADFSAPLYSFNDASAFLVHYNPKARFHSFADAIHYIETTKMVQDELKSMLPEYQEEEEGDDESGDFPLADLIALKAGLLTDQFSKEELAEMLLDAKKKTLMVTDEIVADRFFSAKKELSHSDRTEYNRLIFLYTTLTSDLDASAFTDIDNVLSLMYGKAVHIAGSAKEKVVYGKIREVFNVYDDVFSEERPFAQTIAWLKRTIWSILRMYQVV